MAVIVTCSCQKLVFSSYDIYDESRFAVSFLKSKVKTDVGRPVSEPLSPSDNSEEVIIGIANNAWERNALFYLVGWVAFNLKGKVQPCT